MNKQNTMIYLWLYLNLGLDALPRLINALSIPQKNVYAGIDPNDNLSGSAICHFPVQGDFALSCEIRLADWNHDAAHTALRALSKSGLKIALSDDSNNSPFAHLLFETGHCRAVTVVIADATDVVTMYEVAG